jgi:RhoGAP domain
MNFTTSLLMLSVSQSQKEANETIEYWVIVQITHFNSLLFFLANKARDDQIQTFYQLVQQLPAEHYNTLKYLMLHLDK